MPSRLHTIAETPPFFRDAASAGLSDAEVRAIVDMVAANPRQGDEVQGSGGVRKVRVAGRGKGKSGGYRIMVAFVGDEAPAYLLALLSKGDRGNFTAAEIAQMKALTAAIKRHWQERRGTR